MTHSTPRTSWRRACAVLALAGVSTLASAAPYAISYQGTIQSSSFPEIHNGETYAVTFVFDNGGSSANSQSWTGANLTCTIWRMNNARNVSFAQDLVATPAPTSGSVTTNGAGALTGIFSDVVGFPPAGAYTSVGVALTPPLDWYANSANNVFYDTSNGFGDAAGGVPMNIANWSAPQPFSGGCSALPPPAAVAPVPTLGEWGLALLGLAAAGLGARRLRRRA